MLVICILSAKGDITFGNKFVILNVANLKSFFDFLSRLHNMIKQLYMYVYTCASGIQLRGLLYTL